MAKKITKANNKVESTASINNGVDFSAEKNNLVAEDASIEANASAINKDTSVASKDNPQIKLEDQSTLSTSQFKNAAADNSAEDKNTSIVKESAKVEENTNKPNGVLTEQDVPAVQKRRRWLMFLIIGFFVVAITISGVMAYILIYARSGFRVSFVATEIVANIQISGSNGGDDISDNISSPSIDITTLDPSFKGATIYDQTFKGKGSENAITFEFFIKNTGSNPFTVSLEELPANSAISVLYQCQSYDTENEPSSTLSTYNNSVPPEVAYNESVRFSITFTLLSERYDVTFENELKFYLEIVREA